MTREDAIKILEDERYVIWESASEKTFAMTRNEAFDMAIEALENERPKGHWLDRNGVLTSDLYAVYCSECKNWSEYASNYCMNCGADMRGESDEII